MIRKIITLFIIQMMSLGAVSAQHHHKHYTEQDTLRGSITKERVWWDLQHYTLAVEVIPSEKFIKGSNTVAYKVLEQNQIMQIDLQEPMNITKVVQAEKELDFKRNGNAFFITLEKKQKKGTLDSVTVYYEGHPREAVRAPWDGGFTWGKDSEGKDFIATSCQGLGASVWWPNKDHMYDEPDHGIRISVEVPQDLMDVSNGRLIGVDKNKKKKTKTYHWEVVNPINNYGVNVNIGNYTHFGEKYEGEKGELSLDYYVLKQNLKKAKAQFVQTKEMMEAFEHWFGPYPFYEDGFKLVEVPYLGMEHQSSVTYGNKYQNGYLGRDLSHTGWGLKFDFIIIHEAGHEWFANNITNVDIADMWIHESFTAYSESLFVEYHYGKDAGTEYVRGTRMNISNDIPVIGDYDVNAEGSGDMYYKGSNMLNTIRQIVNNDEMWLGMLRGMNKTFYHQTVTTKQIEDFMSKDLKVDLSKVFDQYLREKYIPILEYKVIDNQVMVRFTSCIDEFEMPVDLIINNENNRVTVTNQWSTIETKQKVSSVEIDKNFYIGVAKIQ
ncbi:M1 family metallopeptidase [Flammeovirga agarivorans]|uniref:M1 family metallopeptidase n=1 Tax=Flammeovirga agarivorans TaxID=2726742 RepID=A0A7X8XYA3_9BACT|nr:M1 family metallopeptidase [Flammeovirga agarivorans]NLR94022.1 M1 family metallopeptidase [Flammeovirga agarivorans]